MVKTFDCIKCGGNHTRPIKRNCKIETDKGSTMDTNTQILKELQSLSGRMTQMEDWMEAMGSTSSPARSHSSSLASQKSPVSQRSHPDSRSPEQDLLLPTLKTVQIHTGASRLKDQGAARTGQRQVQITKGRVRDNFGKERGGVTTEPCVGG